MSSGGNPQFRYAQPPSKVIHLRNLPWDCTDEELLELGTPFGKVVNTKCNVGANQNEAFIEFADQNQAIAMISYHASSAEPALEKERSRERGDAALSTREGGVGVGARRRILRLQGPPSLDLAAPSGEEERSGADLGEEKEWFRSGAAAVKKIRSGAVSVKRRHFLFIWRLRVWWTERARWSGRSEAVGKY